MKGLGIIQARMGSERFNGKSLLTIGDEKVIYHCYRAAIKSEVLDHTIVATTTEKEDDVLVNYLESKNIDYFRGDKDNVYSRFYKIIEIYNPLFIARLTGDNPLIDHNVISQVVKTHIKNNTEYSSNTIERTWPRGNDVECVNSSLLTSLSFKKLSRDEQEHVTLYIRKNLKNYKYCSVKNNENLNFPQLRMTLDYEEDYKLISELFRLLKDKNLQISSINIDSLIVENPSLLEINKNVEQTSIDGIKW